MTKPQRAAAGSRDILGSRDWAQIPIPGFWKIKSRDFSGFIISNKTMILKTFIGFFNKTIPKDPGKKMLG